MFCTIDKIFENYMSAWKIYREQLIIYRKQLIEYIEIINKIFNNFCFEDEEFI